MTSCKNNNFSQLTEFLQYLLSKWSDIDSSFYFVSCGKGYGKINIGRHGIGFITVGGSSTYGKKNFFLPFLLGWGWDWGGVGVEVGLGLGGWGVGGLGGWAVGGLEGWGVGGLGGWGVVGRVGGGVGV